MLNQVYPTLLVTSTIWCFAILAAPVAGYGQIYELFAIICHQDPGRSWRLLGEPLPVCIRCASIYFGFLASLLIRLPLNTRWLSWSIVIGLAEFLLARALVDSATLRCLTGLMFGAAAAPFVKQGIEEMWGNGRVSV